MQKKLFVIGNGFDIGNKLHTSFDYFSKVLARLSPDGGFIWDLYQTHNPFELTKDNKIDRTTGIWSDFENLLAKPNFESIDNIFTDFDYRYRSKSEIPHYIESFKIINTALELFAQEAINQIPSLDPNEKYITKFGDNALFINFNYTSTLEDLYHINADNILHIHGALNHKPLIFGYPISDKEDDFSPEEYTKPRMIDYEEKRKGLENLKNYFESLYKEYDTKKLGNFISDMDILEIEMIGHAYKVDFAYFDYLHKLFPEAHWILNWFSDSDRENALKFKKKFGLNAELKRLK